MGAKKKKKGNNGVEIPQLKTSQKEENLQMSCDYSFCLILGIDYKGKRLCSCVEIIHELPFLSCLVDNRVMERK